MLWLKHRWLDRLPPQFFLCIFFEAKQCPQGYPWWIWNIAFVQQRGVFICISLFTWEICMFPKIICLNSTVSVTGERYQIPNCAFSKQSSEATGTDSEQVGERPASWHHQIFYKLSLTFYNNFYVTMRLHFLTKMVLTTLRKTVNQCILENNHQHLAQF